jgi:Holliday junction resolvasome RuvABC DNA-binding subunit
MPSPAQPIPVRAVVFLINQREPCRKTALSYDGPKRAARLFSIHLYEEKKTMCNKYAEPWKNDACLGFAITAMENLGYKPTKIAEAVIELNELFDLLTLDDAEEAYTDSDY